MQIIQGLPGSDGVAIGRAVCVETGLGEVYRFPVDDGDLEVERFRRAVTQAQAEVHRLGRRVGAELGDELAGIFEAHALLLEDTTFLRLIEDRILKEMVNAEWAVLEVQDELQERFSELESEHLRERGEDLRDVGRYLLRTLQGLSHHEISEIEGDVIIVAHDLTPSDAVRLGRQQVVGFALESGGRTSHTVIIAHSLNIPLVTGLAGVTRQVTTEDPVIVDGSSGSLILHPTSEVLADFSRRRTQLRRQVSDLRATRQLSAVTADGEPFQLMANIDLPEEIDDAVAFGSSGIGLYRSEFLYIERSPQLPTEEDHLALYRKLLEAVQPNPVVVRTYDLGGRKLAREVMHTREENPVLGLRGIRLTMARPEVFRTQLRGLFRAACHGDLWIMLPMVCAVEEVRAFRRFAASVMGELEADNVPFRRDFKLGAMIEVPSAALVSHHLAREVEFFSIGTNDLIQYALAVDRNNEHVTDLYQPLHPAILQMIATTVQNARRAGIPVSVCGEMAGDSLCAPVLFGLGVRRFSMSPRTVPSIKTTLRALRRDSLETLASRCLELATAEEITALVQASLPAVAGEPLLT